MSIYNIIDYCINTFSSEGEIYQEYLRRAEEAKQKYYDARKYPRKTKKRMKKEAIFDYNFYIGLAESFSIMNF